MTKSGINYTNPQVTLLHATPLSVAECAARTAYNSFDKSEHESIRNFPATQKAPDISSSDLLHQLAHVHFHHSVLELCNLSYSITGTSRAVLQEHSRHRIQSLTVQSTRYTLGPIINAFLATVFNSKTMVNANTIDVSYSVTNLDRIFFYNLLESIDFLILDDYKLRIIEYRCIFDKLCVQFFRLGFYEFQQIATSKDMRTNGATAFEQLQLSKQPRNIGDHFKHIVTDNFKVDMVVSFNLRSLKNYLDLRNNGAAFFQIQALAQAIEQATPSKYLSLIIKETK